MKKLTLPLLLPLLSVGFAACNPGVTGPASSMRPSGQTDYPYANVASTPHPQTLEEGEALENQMAKEAEEKAQHENEPANQVRSQQDKIEQQIQEEQEKAEGYH